VAPDDLNTPLGQNKPAKKSARLPVPAMKAIAAGLGLFVLAFILWAAVVNNPLGGEPVVVVSADPPALPDLPPPDDGPTASVSTKPSAAPNTITIIDGSSGKTQEVVIPGAPETKPAAGIDTRLVEISRHGPIPMIAANGARPSEVYARPLKSGQPSAPRVALIIGGLGMASGGTAEALAKMPAPVTLAFAPDGNDLENLVARARDSGHEMLLQVPMEPFDAETNPGAHTLLTSLPAEQNIDRLHWLMSRFQGYVGIGNFTAGRFSASQSALAPVLRETAKRGLLYVEDSSSPRSVAGQIAGANKLPYAKVEIVLDASPKADDIDKALSRLEALARERGTAVGLGQALPLTIDRLAKWVKAAAARGIVLVPISAVAVRAKSG
jgi:uncharacterized protein